MPKAPSWKRERRGCTIPRGGEQRRCSSRAGRGRVAVLHGEIKRRPATPYPAPLPVIQVPPIGVAFTSLLATPENVTC